MAKSDAVAVGIEVGAGVAGVALGVGLALASAPSSAVAIASIVLCNLKKLSCYHLHSKNTLGSFLLFGAISVW